MQPEIAAERPPYVRFERRAQEDRAASIEAGHYVSRDIDFALITPMGSKDCIHRICSEWFENLTQQCQEGRFKIEWLGAFKASYAAWKEGKELPVSGTPILLWPAISPAQQEAILGARIRTVEDLAIANEEALHRIGMGGRALKDRAIQWLASAKDTGKLAERMAALETANATLLADNKLLVAQLEKLLPKQSPKPI